MQTPFEIDGVKSTLAEGVAFLSALDSAQANVSLTDYGTSVLGNAMTAAKVGSGPVRVCVIGSIHGSEPAGREAAFKFLRDLAESTDPGIVSYLASNAWSFMCTANPDKITAGVRENQNGIDLNRDFAAQTQPETQAMAAWLNATDPVLILDLHETSNTAIPDTALAVTTHAGVHAALVARSTALRDTVEAALIAAGNGVVPYPFDTATAGTSLTEAGRIWKASALTFETYRISPKTLAQRVAEQMVTCQTVRLEHEANAAAYITAQTTAQGGTPPPDPDPDPPSEDRRYFVHVNGNRIAASALRLRFGGVTTTIWTPVP
jgi:predicted deacylase